VVSTKAAAIYAVALLLLWASPQALIYYYSTLPPPQLSKGLWDYASKDSPTSATIHAQLSWRELGLLANWLYREYGGEAPPPHTYVTPFASYLDLWNADYMRRAGLSEGNPCKYLEGLYGLGCSKVLEVLEGENRSWYVSLGLALPIAWALRKEFDREATYFVGIAYMDGRGIRVEVYDVWDRAQASAMASRLRELTGSGRAVVLSDAAFIGRYWEDQFNRLVSSGYRVVFYISSSRVALNPSIHMRPDYRDIVERMFAAIASAFGPQVASVLRDSGSAEPTSDIYLVVYENGAVKALYAPRCPPTPSGVSCTATDPWGALDAAVAIASR